MLFILCWPRRAPVQCGVDTLGLRFDWLNISWLQLWLLIITKESLTPPCTFTAFYPVTIHLTFPAFPQPHNAGKC